MPPLNDHERDVLDMEAEIIASELVEEFEEMWMGDRKEEDDAEA